MLAAINISKSFGNKNVLNNVSLTLLNSETTVLFGESGCGKTTLMRTLAFLDKPDKGLIEIDGDKFLAERPFNIRDTVRIYPKITVVFQQLFLWPHLTNRQNILLALDKNRIDYKEQVDYFNFYLSKEMELTTYLDNYPNQSSLGQKQRVAITRALILKPKYLLLDEITASLDNVQTNKIAEIIKKIKLLGEISILYITHNIKIAQLVGDKFAFLNNGIIKEYGGCEILTNPKTEELRNYMKYT